MNEQIKHGLWPYIIECAHILYRAYFKPITFRRWLRTIDADLENTTNPFSLREHFADNPRLHRYAWQVWWIVTLVPTFFVIMTGISYPLFARQSFNWSRSGQFLVGWWLGLLLARGVPKRLMNIATWFMWLVFILTALWNTGFSPRLIANVLGYRTLALIYDLIPYFEVIRPFAFGVAFGVAGGVAVGVAGGVAFGVAFGVAGGVAFGVAVGVAVGATWILGVLRVYFWLFEFLWMLFLVFFALGRTHARWLHMLPPYFDQLIYLPLPFMDEFIAHAYEENQALARQTIEYLITSTNQQKAAASAITIIATDALERCATTSDIIALAEQLAWISTPPPPALGTWLPQFVEISQSVRAALKGTSAYRQYEMLGRPLLMLHKIREALAFADVVEATTFGSIVDKWLGILETARQNLETRAKASAEIPQVYLPGPALDPDLAGGCFKGRLDLFRQIETLALLPQRPVLLLYGGRRSGKTSALNYLPRRTGPEIVPLLIDVQGLITAMTPQGFTEGLAQQIMESARRTRNLRLPMPELAGDPFIALEEWMKQAEKVTGHRTLLLCLDEYERLSEFVEATHSRAPLNFLRHIMQHRPRWTLLFAGSHLLDALPTYWSDYLINTQALRVSYLNETDTRDLIRHPTEDFPDIYDDATVDGLVHLTHGQPYLVQLLCYEIVERLNLEKRKQANVQDIDTVISAVFEHGYHYFREWWETSTTVEQREVLVAIAQDRPLLPSQQNAAEALVKAESLKPAKDTYRFQVPLLQRWVELKTANSTANL